MSEMSTRDLVRYLKSRRSGWMDRAADRIIELETVAKSLQRQNAELENALREILKTESKVQQIARGVLE